MSSDDDSSKPKSTTKIKSKPISGNGRDNTSSAQNGIHSTTSRKTTVGRDSNSSSKRARDVKPWWHKPMPIILATTAIAVIGTIFMRQLSRRKSRA